MSVLARTFSVGKSMHHLKSRKGLGSMSSEVDGDEESQGPLSARTAGEDGSRHGGGDLAAVSSIPKSASEATIRDGSEESVSEACLEEG